MEVSWRSIYQFKVVSLVFWQTDFFVYMDGHLQAVVVLFGCPQLKQNFQEATIGITGCASSLFGSLFLAPPSVARGGCVA